MPSDFDSQMKSLREKVTLLEERARIAEAQARISKSNLEHQKSLASLAEFKAQNENM